MTPKRPRDPNEIAKAIIDIATGEKPNPLPLRDGSPFSGTAIGTEHVGTA
jgi:hypothetical protein